MNVKDLYFKIIGFERCERTLNWELGYWGGALNRWYEEGLPKKYGLEREVDYGDAVCGPGLHYPILGLSDGYKFQKDRDVADFFNFDDGIIAFPINSFIHPKDETIILEETEEKVKLIDGDGITKIVIKGSRMTQWIGWPVKDFHSWEEFKEKKFKIDYEKRLAKNFSEYENKIKENKNPLILFGEPIGFYGSLRFLLGEENLLYMYYDNPKLIKSINAFLTNFWINIAEEILGKYEIMVADFYEDMSGKNGPLISPITFREFISPYYKRIIGFLKSKGVKYFNVDTDGNIDIITPLFLETGITGIYPVERQAGNDLLKIRNQYPDLVIIGGFDKNVLAKGKYEIDKELENIKKMIEKGGYIPICDHHVPPNVSWLNFKYYRERLTDIIYKTKVYF